MTAEEFFESRFGMTVDASKKSMAMYSALDLIKFAKAYKGEDKIPSDEEIKTVDVADELTSSFNKNEDKMRICVTIGCNNHPEKGNKRCKGHQLYFDEK